MTKGFLALECECDGLSVSASAWSEYDSVVLGDSSISDLGSMLLTLINNCFFFFFVFRNLDCFWMKDSVETLHI